MEQCGGQHHSRRGWAALCDAVTFTSTRSARSRFQPTGGITSWTELRSCFSGPLQWWCLVLYEGGAVLVSWDCKISCFCPKEMRCRGSLRQPSAVLCWVTSLLARGQLERGTKLNRAAVFWRLLQSPFKIERLSLVDKHYTFLFVHLSRCWKEDNCLPWQCWLKPPFFSPHHWEAGTAAGLELSTSVGDVHRGLCAMFSLCSLGWLAQRQFYAVLQGFPTAVQLLWWPLPGVHLLVGGCFLSCTWSPSFLGLG